ncbi:hypothetical protein FE257_002680 [Aspergillus nanangensis]|uniref:Uncharacterized protein n=1 Tax=Aspergillus nanangensis TaxID=2582783 RepID=A0AAD4GNY7_ASPNN|nr:hypothetical protein FE257_002680 [Aspergillus nanangensis]
MIFLPQSASPAVWPVAIIAGLSLPMHAHQLINPQRAMKRYDANSVVCRVLAIILVFINTCDLIASLQGALFYVFISYAARIMTLCLFALEGGKWRTAAKFEGIMVGGVAVLAVFLSSTCIDY